MGPLVAQSRIDIQPFRPRRVSAQDIASESYVFAWEQLSLKMRNRRKERSS